MLTPQFGNYQRNYQLRLGFLKVVARVGKAEMGGRRAILDRLESLYPDQRGRFRRGPFGHLNVNELVRQEDVPSWQVGFGLKTIDRLVSWAEMVGIIAPTGRLSEWSLILQGLDREKFLSWDEQNPFILSVEERAFFIQLLFYHDQVLPRLVRRLTLLSEGDAIDGRNMCPLVIEALGDFRDSIVNTGQIGRRVLREVSDLLESIGQEYRLREPRFLIHSSSRHDQLAQIRDVLARKKAPRALRAERQAVCRLEHLTDLGFLTKCPPDGPRQTARKDPREKWNWYVTPALTQLTEVFPDHEFDLEVLLTHKWMQLSGIVAARTLKRLDPKESPKLIAHYLDLALPSVKRRIGFTQCHTWVTLACLLAYRDGYKCELHEITEWLEALRTDPTAAERIRFAGHRTFRGRNITLTQGTVLEAISSGVDPRQSDDT